MPTTPRKSFQPAQRHLKNNPKVSVSVVEQYRKLETELHRLGVDTRPEYTLSHPFDRTVFQNSLKQSEKPKISAV